MSTYWIEAYPYAVQNGTIEVPDNIPEDDVEKYIEEHWKDIIFEEKPRLSYKGADFDWGLES